MAWSYFHWGLTAWAMYGIVAICLAYSHHNLGKKLTFRDAVVDIFPRKSRRGAGMVIELLAILATVLGLSTSFGFATLQFTSGISAITGIHASAPLWIAIIVALGALTAGSVFFGISKGMKRISEINSVLSIVLLVAVFAFGPIIYLASTLSQTFGAFFQNFLAMSLWTDSGVAAAGIGSCRTAGTVGGRSSSGAGSSRSPRLWEPSSPASPAAGPSGNSSWASPLFRP